MIEKRRVLGRGASSTHRAFLPQGCAVSFETVYRCLVNVRGKHRLRFGCGCVRKVGPVVSPSAWPRIPDPSFHRKFLRAYSSTRDFGIMSEHRFQSSSIVSRGVENTLTPTLQMLSTILLFGGPEAYSSFVNHLAWAGDDPAVDKPKSTAAKGKKSGYASRSVSHVAAGASFRFPLIPFRVRRNLCLGNAPICPICGIDIHRPCGDQ